MTHSRVSQLEVHFPAEFSSNPNQSHLNKLIKVFRINRKLQAGEFLSRLELNSAGTWTSRARASDIQNVRKMSNTSIFTFNLTARVIKLITSFLKWFIIQICYSVL